MISEGEKAFIVDGILQDLRSDGRGCEDFRPISLEVNVIPTANGSAWCQLGKTNVMVGVKADPVAPLPEHPAMGMLALTVEWSPCAGPGLQNRAGDDTTQQWLRALERCLLPTASGKGCGLDLKTLCINEGKHVWLLNVDCIVLCADGSVVDALSLAVKAALMDTEIPGLKVTPTEDPNEEPELELDEDAATPLDASRVPVLLTVHQVRGTHVLDATAEEEACTTGAVQVGLGPLGTLHGLTLSTLPGVTPSSIQEMVSVAQRVAPHVSKALDSYLEGAMEMED